MGETEQLTVKAITELQKYKEKYDKVVEVVNKYKADIMDEKEATSEIIAIMGLDYSVGDICRYKGYTDRFMITSIELGKYFDGVYESGKTINDGTLSLVERVGHYNKLEDFLNWIKEDKDND
jgi:hypothetical protein